MNNDDGKRRRYNLGETTTDDDAQLEIG